MYITVCKVLRTHIVKMVRHLQFSPVCNDFFVAGFLDSLFKPIKCMNGVGLHCVSKPGREGSFGIGLAYQMRHINRAHGLIMLGYLSGCFEIVVRML